MDKPTARKIFQEAAEDSSRVIFDQNHGEPRLKERGITDAQAFRALKTGWIVEGPYMDQKNCWRSNLKTFCEGSPLVVVAAICESDEDDQVVVITGFWPAK